VTISLPTTPTGDEYEDYVAATLRALGYFVETRLKLREEKKEVLELDIVTTPLGSGSAERELYEAKKDGISFTNLFKLYGQRIYLGINGACLASLKDAAPEYRPAYDAKGAELTIRVCNHQIDPSQAANLAPIRNNLTDDQRRIAISTAWYLQIAKRLALAALTQRCSAEKGNQYYEDVRQYNFDVGASFFRKTPLERAEGLYDAYKERPRLTGDGVALLAKARGVSDKVIWDEAQDTHKHLWLQYLMLLEGVARISIVKNALDDILERGDAPLPTASLKIGGNVFRFPKHDLPSRFVEGLDLLRKHPHNRHLPYLYQCFLELFGGFVFLEDDEELTLLESFTKIPKAEIVGCIELLDHFFAPEGGSFFYKIKSRILSIKMIPGIIRGTGCFLRQSMFGITNYSTRYSDLGWLLSKWHNAAYYALEPELKAEPEVPAV
jgi:hypothetical protein